MMQSHTMPSEPAIPERDAALMERYGAHLAAQGTPWRTREPMQAAAVSFLCWWRSRFVGNDYDVTDAGAMRDAHVWPDAREAWLRHVCADRELRVEARMHLNRFLCFLGESVNR
jgi:hypothetical protein